MNGTRRKSVICERVVTNHNLRNRKISSIRGNFAKTRRVSLPSSGLDYGSPGSSGKEHNGKAATNSTSSINSEFIEKDECDYLNREEYDVAKRRILLEIQKIEKQELEDIFQNGVDLENKEEENKDEEKEEIERNILKEKQRKQNVNEDFVLTRFLKWMAKEHSIILEFSLYLPLLLMSLYLVLIEGTPLYTYVDRTHTNDTIWASYVRNLEIYISEIKNRSLQLLHHIDDKNVNIRLT